MKAHRHAISVCGCHGKTTTTSLLAHALVKLGKEVNYFIGTTVEGTSFENSSSNKEFIVAESDEFAVDPPQDKTPKFHLLQPTHVICTNIDYDHPDVYSSLEETKKAFLTFFEKPRAENLFFCADNEPLMDVAKQLKNKPYKTFGFSPTADLKIENPHIDEFHSVFDLVYQNVKLGTFNIDLYGNHNISNAAGVILCLLTLGFDVDDIRKAVAGFSGVKRRFELVGEENNIYLLDDYAHHPE
jgi:UDP-N-acetylmuramate--alanine ligase